MLHRASRQLVWLNSLVLSFLFVLPALECVLVRLPVTLTSRYPYAALAAAYACAGLLVFKLDGAPDKRALWFRAGVVASSLALLLLGALASLAILDTSWDGLAYHQPAIYQLQSGWNPAIRQLDTTLFPNNLWVNEYPKAPWYASSVLLGLFSNIEASKLSFFLAATTFIAALRVLLVYEVPLLWRGLVSALVLVLNPVAIVQVWQFYVDGVLFYLLVIGVLCALAYAREQRPLDLIVLVATGVFVANVKFTGPIYFSALFGWLAADQLRWSGDRGRSLRTFAAAYAGWLLAVALTGFNPYLTHLLAGKHLFYPIMGQDSLDIVTAYVPAELRSRSWLGQLVATHVTPFREGFSWHSLLSEFALDGSGQIGPMRVDSRIGAFGRYFWISYLLAYGAVLTALIRARAQRAAFGVLCLTVFSLLNPVVWWARYVPQLWAAPVIAGSVALALWHTRATWPVVALSLYLMAVSAQLYAGQSWSHQLGTSAKLKKQRRALEKKLQEKPALQVGTDDLGAHVFWLQRRGITLEWLPKSELASCEDALEQLTLRVCSSKAGGS